MAHRQKGKICIVSDSLGNGGAERSAGLLSIILEDLGYKVHHILIVDIVSYPYKGKLHNLGKLSKFQKFKSYFKILREEKFDVVLDFRMKDHLYRELLISSFFYRNQKAVNMVRHYRLSYYFPSTKPFFAKLFNTYVDHNVVSDDIKGQIRKVLGFQNLSRIYSPIDIKAIKKASETSLEIKDRYIIAAGRLNAIKQFDKLIDSYSKSILPEKGIRLLILGEGMEKANLNQLIEQKGLDEKVQLLAFQENPFKYMKKAVFLALSSKGEGFPRVLLEALSCGVPVVSFDCKSGPREIIVHEKNGLLVEDQNQKALTLAMNRFVTDKNLYDFCKSNAEASIQQFSMKAIGEQWETYLKKLYEV